MSHSKLCGVYKIVNIVNNKVYIGSSVNIKYRLNTHKRLLRQNKHFNYHLQSSYNKHGESSFLFVQLEITTKEQMIEREQYWIDFLKVTDPKIGYNKRLIATTNLGIKLSEETRKKLSISHLGHKRSKEAQLKISASQFVPVVQIDFDGNIVCEYSSILEASEKTGAFRTGISMCLSGKIYSTAGYHWCKKQDLSSFVLPKYNKKKISNQDKELWKKLSKAASTSTIVEYQQQHH